jgi:hypothetical protein
MVVVREEGGMILGTIHTRINTYVHSAYAEHAHVVQKCMGISRHTAS